MSTNRLVVKEQVATYASIMLDSAYEAGGQDGVLEVREQMRTVLSALRGNLDLAAALKDTTYTPGQRSEIARNVFGECNPVLVDVLGVMAERDDIELLSRVWESFEQQLESKLNICVVDVTTVVELDDRLRETIIKKAESELGMKVVLRERIDPSILGGIIMSTGGRRIDASIQLQLDRARNVLKQSTDGGEC